MERLDYNNPYGYNIERVSFDGRVIFATEQGELDVDPKRVKVAQEYQIVYSVEFGADGKLKPETHPDRVPGQLNIYDSVPGTERTARSGSSTTCSCRSTTRPTHRVRRRTA